MKAGLRWGLFLSFFVFSFSTFAKDNPSQFGFDKQQQYDIITEEIEGDPFFNTPQIKPMRVPPIYDISIQAGAFIPSASSDIFKSYYTKKPMYADLSASRVFWLKAVGISAGLQGFYMSSNGSGQYVLDPNNSLNLYKHEFYAYELGGIVQARLRTTYFLFFQPSIFFEGGLAQFEDTATPYDTSYYPTVKISESNPYYRGGVNFDFSVSAITQDSHTDVPGNTITDILIRVSISQAVNDAKSGLSLTGTYYSAGLAFLIN